MSYDIEIEKFRDGILMMNTRRFGNVAEIMIEKLYNLEGSDNLAFDKRDTNTNDRVEVKFSRTQEKNNDTININNVIEQIGKANVLDRMIKSTEAEVVEFDCNIQQIKCEEFDVLYYGLFFADIIEIYKMTSHDIPNCQGYSNKQHRNNEGEGQFHINNTSIKYHRENFFERFLNYSELFELLKD
ncbi:MAG: hypothetical protein IJF94_04875 [Eubacterium sp.]|nr:hypothetical protein [Eubacterium sp.]